MLVNQTKSAIPAQTPVRSIPFVPESRRPGPVPQPGERRAGLCAVGVAGDTDGKVPLPRRVSIPGMLRVKEPVPLVEFGDQIHVPHNLTASAPC